MSKLSKAGDFSVKFYSAKRGLSLANLRYDAVQAERLEARVKRGEFSPEKVLSKIASLPVRGNGAIQATPDQEVLPNGDRNTPEREDLTPEGSVVGTNVPIGNVSTANGQGA